MAHNKCTCHAELEQIAGILREILSRLPVPTSLKILRLGENTVPTDFSIAPGSTAVLQILPLPAGTSLLPAPNLSLVADDPQAVIVPHVAGVGGIPADSTGTVFDVSIPVGDTQGSSPAGSPPGFNLGASGPDGAGGATITGSQFMSIVGVTPPPPSPTSLGFAQLA